MRRQYVHNAYSAIVTFFFSFNLQHRKQTKRIKYWEMGLFSTWQNQWANSHECGALIMETAFGFVWKTGTVWPTTIFLSLLWHVSRCKGDFCLFICQIYFFYCSNIFPMFTFRRNKLRTPPPKKKQSVMLDRQI